MGWGIAGGLCGSIVFVALAWLFIADYRSRARRTYVRDYGERLLAWIVPTHAHEMENFYLVMVIFTFDKTIDDLPRYLEGIATSMMELSPRSTNAEEAEVARWVREMDSFEMYSSRSPLPLSLTDGRTVYCTKTYARKELLPRGELALPYIYVAAVTDIPNTLAEMVEYPDVK